jgi:hypothetical protein
MEIIEICFDNYTKQICREKRPRTKKKERKRKKGRAGNRKNATPALKSCIYHLGLERKTWTWCG